MSTDIIYCESDQKYCAFNGAPTTTVMQVQLPKEPPTANTMCRQFAVKGYLTATVMRSLSGLLCFESGPQQPLQCATYEFCFWRENTHMVPFCNYCHTKSVTSSHPSSRWYGSWFTQLANHLRDAFRELWTRLRCVLCKGLFLHILWPGTPTWNAILSKFLIVSFWFMFLFAGVLLQINVDVAVLATQVCHVRTFFAMFEFEISYLLWANLFVSWCVILQNKVFGPRSASKPWTTSGSILK